MIYLFVLHSKGKGCVWLNVCLWEKEREGGRAKGGIKGVKYMVIEGNLTLGGEGAMWCICDALLNCTLETCAILWISVTPKISNKKMKKAKRSSIVTLISFMSLSSAAVPCRSPCWPLPSVSEQWIHTPGPVSLFTEAPFPWLLILPRHGRILHDRFLIHCAISVSQFICNFCPTDISEIRLLKLSIFPGHKSLHGHL